jgi:hypothetical protein
MTVNAQLPFESSSNSNKNTINWTYLNVFSLFFIVCWILLALLSLAHLWCSFNLFHSEVQDVPFEMIDFRNYDADTKPREMIRLVKLREEIPSSTIV